MWITDEPDSIKKSGLSLASSVSSQPMAASCQSTDRQGCSLATPDTLGNSWIKKQKYKKSPGYTCNRLALQSRKWRVLAGPSFFKGGQFSIKNTLAHTSWPDVCESRVQVSPLLAQLGLKWCNKFCCLNGTPSQSWPTSWVISQLWLLQRNPHGCCYSKEIQKTNVGVTFYG